MIICWDENLAQHVDGCGHFLLRDPLIPAIWQFSTELAKFENMRLFLQFASYQMIWSSLEKILLLLLCSSAQTLPWEGALKIDVLEVLQNKPCQAKDVPGEQFVIPICFTLSCVWSTNQDNIDDNDTWTKYMRMYPRLSMSSLLLCSIPRWVLIEAYRAVPVRFLFSLKKILSQDLGTI